MRIAVVGGGISGLATAHFLTRVGHDVVCVTPEDRPGGAIRSERRDGFLCETGPQAILDGPEQTRRLIREVGLEARLVRADPRARRRFIFRGGRLHAVPTGPWGLVTTDVLSATGKLRLLREPFVGAQSSDEDESVLDFARRRFGDEAAVALVAPAVIGIYAGDAARLSLGSALPRLRELERGAGSVVKGFLRSRKAAGARLGKLISFHEGLEDLPRAIAGGLGGRLVRGEASRIMPSGSTWRVEGTGFPPLEVGQVVLAARTESTANLLEPLCPGAAAGLRSVPAASVAVICLGFRARPPGVDLDAYGFLVARGEAPTILGCQYESSIFPSRAPADAVLLRVIAGGVFDPGLVDRSDADIVAHVRRDLATVLGLDTAPDFTAVFRHRAAIPQPHVGHAALVAEIDREIARLPGLHVLGHALRGVGVNDCIKAAADLSAGIAPTV